MALPDEILDRPTLGAYRRANPPTPESRARALQAVCDAIAGWHTVPTLSPLLTGELCAIEMTEGPADLRGHYLAAVTDDGSPRVIARMLTGRNTAAEDTAYLAAVLMTVTGACQGEPVRRLVTSRAVELEEAA